jgi:pullulanase
LVPVNRDAFGVIFELDTSQFGKFEKLGFILRKGDWESKDGGDRFITKPYPKECWIVAGNPVTHTKKPSTSPFVESVFVDGARTLSVVLSRSVNLEQVRSDFFTVLQGRQKLPIADIHALQGRNGKSRGFYLTLRESLPADPKLLSKIRVTARGYRNGIAQLRRVLDAPAFTWGGPLGCRLMPQQTVFHVYAPDAGSMEVLLKNSPEGPIIRTLKMKYEAQGVWSTRIKENLEGKFYRYRVNRGGKIVEAIDPYAICNIGYLGWSHITDLTHLTPTTTTDEMAFDDAIIYELHLRDFTIDPKSGVKAKGVYSGLTEKGTRFLDNTKIRTGLDHLEELGINTVQIMPVQSFAHDENSEDYNWGYMPAHYFSLDGWFATKKSDDSRLKEFKSLVDALHQRKMKVVIDVVYNHTTEGTGSIISFMGLAPWYYYRTSFDGSFENGSGCGNEFRTEAPMARRLILDSLRHFIEVFGVDGFRFDLMGLIDYETLLSVVKELKVFKPDVMIYGEPWGGGTTSFAVHGKGVQHNQGFSVFNDTFRDAMKGSVWSLDPGYIQKGWNKEKVMEGITGSIHDFAARPAESINYIDCHDNRTFLDRLLITSETTRENDILAMTRLGATLLMTSQGVPFIHSGQEMLRSKGGSHNSYDQPDSVNMLRWENKEKYLDLFKYYKGLINLRKEHPMFRMKSAAEVNANLHFLDRDLGIDLPGNTIAYHLSRGNSGDEWSEVLVIFNPSSHEVTLKIPGKGYKVAVNRDSIHLRGVKLKRRLISDKVTVKGRSAMVLFKK